jgi:hypothetical protein
MQNLYPLDSWPTPGLVRGENGTNGKDGDLSYVGGEMSGGEAARPVTAICRAIGCRQIAEDGRCNAIRTPAQVYVKGLCFAWTDNPQHDELVTAAVESYRQSGRGAK